MKSNIAGPKVALIKLPAGREREREGEKVEKEKENIQLVEGEKFAKVFGLGDPRKLDEKSSATTATTATAPC